MTERLPNIVRSAWDTYAPGVEPISVEETSANVSTNQVFRLRFAERTTVYAKLSSYGSFVHFRQDHERIERWRQLLAPTEYATLLAPVLTQGGEVYTYHAGDLWVAFYGEVPIVARLPKILSEPQVAQLGREMARFHLACDRVADQLDPTWKTLGSDIAHLFDLLGDPHWVGARSISRSEASYVRDHCNLFLRNADRMGYHRWKKLPVLVDWNLGNFSVTDDTPSFKLFSRWDYDWFRIEPRALDFYFFSRVVSEIGDRTHFSYLVAPLLQPRFKIFLRAYHQVFALTPEELLFLKEAYRFFVLNYVVRIGEHFFQPKYHQHLLGEAVERYLPEVDRQDFSALLDVLEDRHALKETE